MNQGIIAKTVFTILFLVCIYSLKSQSNTIRGEVFDKSTNQPVIGATVIIKDSNPVVATSTNEEGRFIFEKIPVGRYDIEIRFLGYLTFIQKSVQVKNAEETLLSIKLTINVHELNEVTITSDQRIVTNEAALLSARSFKVEELSSIPGGIDDPARMVRKFPGVSPNADVLTNVTNVRGNATRGTRWRLDDMDIYNPNHFGLLDGSGGSLTIFSQKLLTNTDFYSGAFPADFGNALGGVFDMRFRNGNMNKKQHSIQISAIGLDASTEGPMNKKGNSSYLINYRYSTTGLVENFLNLGGIPVFQDISFKLHFKTKGNGAINVFGLGGISSMTNIPEPDSSKWNSTWSNFGSLTKSATGTAGVTYLKPINKKTYIKTTALGTGMKMTQLRYYLDYDYITKDTTRVGNDKDYKFSWQGFINHKFSNKHTHRSGIILNYLNSDVNYMEAENDTLNTLNGTTLVDTMRYGQGSSILIQAYSRSQFYLSSKCQLNVGIHSMLLTLTNELSVEPRLSFRYRLNKSSSINFAYGLHSQMEPFFTYISKQYSNESQSFIRQNHDLKFNKAQHFNIAYFKKFTQQFRIGLETYYQQQYNMVTAVNYPISRVGGYDFTFESFDLNNGGKGQNYGVEFSAERSFNKDYYILGNASIFEANYTANDGITRNSSANARYIFNLVFGKEWRIGKKKGKFNYLSINLSGTSSGPQYFMPLDLQKSVESGYYQADYNQPNALQQNPLTILDASIIYKRNRKKSNSQLTLQATNLLNNRPIVGVAFDRENAEQDIYFGTGFLPIISWRINF